MGVPEIILSVMILIVLISNLYKAGKNDAPAEVAGTLAGAVIEVGLLIWGGFYS